MGCLSEISQSLRLPDAQEIGNLDHAAATERHQKIIEQKKFLRDLYTDFYHVFSSVMEEKPDGTYLEVGSGGGFLKRLYPSVITSDILQLSSVDICFSGENIPFKANKFDAIFMIDVLHHIKNPSIFLQELQECLNSNGKVIMIEPANTWWGRFIYQNFHHEGFDPSSGWLVEGAGPLSDANGAIPWIIFHRDREKYEKEFPALKIKRIKYHTPFRYLLSGGLSFKQLLPDWAYGVVQFGEFVLSPLSRLLGMFMTIELQKA